MIERGATYSVCTWDPIDDTPQSDCRWHEHATGLDPRDAIRAVRDLFSCGYSEASVLVERDS